jgi:hypothetical protein
MPMGPRSPWLAVNLVPLYYDEVQMSDDHPAARLRDISVPGTMPIPGPPGGSQRAGKPDLTELSRSILGSAVPPGTDMGALEAALAMGAAAAKDGNMQGMFEGMMSYLKDNGKLKDGGVYKQQR